MMDEEKTSIEEVKDSILRDEEHINGSGKLSYITTNWTNPRRDYIIMMVSIS